MVLHNQYSMDIQILSAISGRLRLRIPRLSYDSNYADRIDGNLKVLRFVTGVRVNPAASSIAITYSTKKIPETEAKKAIVDAIVQADRTIEESTPDNVVFLQFDSKSQKETVAESEVAIEQPESVQTSASEATLQSKEPSPDELKETIISEPVETTASEASLEPLQSEEPSETESIALTQEETSSNESKETSIPEPVETTASEASLETLQSEEPSETNEIEFVALTPEETSSNESKETSIPEPVEKTANEAAPESYQAEKLSSNEIATNEETTPLQESASTSAGIESQKNDAVTPTSRHVGETLRLSNLTLARRLGISAQALTVRSSQPDFTQWSMTKDPEQIGWVFIKSLNKFYSVNSV
jgi:Heavy metal associated domain 2